MLEESECELAHMLDNRAESEFQTKAEGERVADHIPQTLSMVKIALLKHRNYRCFSFTLIICRQGPKIMRRCQRHTRAEEYLLLG